MRCISTEEKGKLCGDCLMSLRRLPRARLRAKRVRRSPCRQSLDLPLDKYHRNSKAKVWRRGAAAFYSNLPSQESQGPTVKKQRAPLPLSLTEAHACFNCATCLHPPFQIISSACTIKRGHQLTTLPTTAYFEWNRASQSLRPSISDSEQPSRSATQSAKAWRVLSAPTNTKETFPTLVLNLKHALIHVSWHDPATSAYTPFFLLPPFYPKAASAPPTHLSTQSRTWPAPVRTPSHRRGTPHLVHRSPSPWSHRRSRHAPPSRWAWMGRSHRAQRAALR